MYRTLFWSAFLFFCCASLSAQVIPSSRCSEWSRAGCNFPFPEPDTILNVMDFGAAGDGITNDRPAIQNAINALTGHYKVVFIPAGTYLLLSSLTLTDSVIIRGAGSDSTFLKFAHSGEGIGIYGGSAGTLADLLSGIDRGSQKVRVSNPALFSEGNYTEIREDNGSWDTSPATWATYSVGQIVQIDSIYGDTLYLHDRLRISYDTALHPQIRTFVPRKACSIECLNMERSDTSTAGTGYNVGFNFAVNCRIIGIQSNKSQGSHCMIGQSDRITVSGCFFHDAYMYDGTGTKGYGVTLNNHAGLCLILNNIFKHLRHAMMTKHGANGNVFAYNYSREPYRNGQYEYPPDYCGDISLHGHYSYANLFEGNIIQQIYIDQTWGPSGPHNTFFRNRAEYYGLIMTSALTADQNFVGNEITGTGYTFPFSHGAYTLTGSGHLEYGNNDNGVIVPNGTNILNDNSYFISGQPSFWSIPSPWPSIGAPNSPGSGDIPAHVRYVAGQYADCSDPDIITSAGSPINNLIDCKIFPNPFSDKLYINAREMTGTVIIKMFDITGRMLQEQQFNKPTSDEILFLNTNQVGQKGLYIISIECNCLKKSFLVIRE